MEILEAGSEECLQDLGTGRMNVSYSMSLGGSRTSLEAGSDERLEDPGSGKFNVSYSTVSGGSWARQIPGT